MPPVDRPQEQFSREMNDFRAVCRFPGALIARYIALAAFFPGARFFSQVVFTR
jgi:hypothetical protein